MENLLHSVSNIYITIVLINIYLIFIHIFIYGKEINGQSECDKYFLNSKGKVVFFTVMPIVNLVFGIYLLHEIFILNKEEVE